MGEVEETISAGTLLAICTPCVPAAKEVIRTANSAVFDVRIPEHHSSRSSMSDFFTLQFPTRGTSFRWKALHEHDGDAVSPDQAHRGFFLSYFIPPPRQTRQVPEPWQVQQRGRLVQIDKMPSSFRSRASSCSIAILAVLRRAPFRSALICRWYDCCVTLYASKRCESSQILPRFGCPNTHRNLFVVLPG